MVLLLVFLLSARPSAGAVPPASIPQFGPFVTPIADGMIDVAAAAEWVDGSERRLANPAALRQLLWTRTTAPSSGPIQFGASATPGARHLRLGFSQAVNMGSVLVRGGGELSFLKPGSPYPGNLADDNQWQAATRLVDRKVSSQQVDADSYALWLLPPQTKARALRFTHTASATDSNFAGVLGGVYILSGRYTNVAPQATVSSSANHAATNLLVDEQYNGWKTWDNGPEFSHQVTASTPEWIVLTWPRPVMLAGLAQLWAGYNAADAEVYSGPDNANPQDAPESAWRSIAPPVTLSNQYPLPLGVDWISFNQTASSRAVRLRLTAVTDESHHPHLAGKTAKGKRVWLGELMALEPMQAADLRTAILPTAEDTLPKPPIPVRFSLDSAAFVTLVIEDSKGNRVRNLVSNTWFEKGANTVFWDGTDDLERNADAANHGQYLIPTHFVSPGTYHVRGLFHSAIDLHYEFSIYNPGHPAWETTDTKGGWLTNHTPPSAALFVPAGKAPGGKPVVYLGSYISEGGAGLAWVDLDGNKQGGRGWIGGNWTAAPFIARDSGPNADPSIYAYVGAPTGDNVTQPGKAVNATIRLTGLTAHGDKAILNFSFNPGTAVEHLDANRFDWTHQMGGLAVLNGLGVISLPMQNQLLFVDTRTGKSLGTTALQNAHGLSFDPSGHLLVLSGKRLLRYSLPADTSRLNPEQLSNPDILISDGLDTPNGITIDQSGNIYISDDGNANQVRVYSASGKLLRSIGHPGPSQAGPYDPLHMNSPAGMAIDSNNHLWITEDDFQPKRVSLWTTDGQLLKAFYGPAEYGGGGSLDPQDKTRFYYHAMEFKLDWTSGANTITNILYRPGKDAIPLPPTASPTTVLYSAGHRYFINSYLGHATNGPTIGMLFLDKGGVIHPVAALGKANDWPLLKNDAYKAGLPLGSDLSSSDPDKAILFTWSDTNENGKVDPDELHFTKSTTGSIIITADKAAGSNSRGPAMLNAFIEGKAVRFEPTQLSPSGIPFYDLSKGVTIAQGAQRNASDGGGEILEAPQSVVLTTAPLPFAKEGIGGVDLQGHKWSYPSLWPGLHPSHSAPIPDHPGDLIGTTHLLGPFINPPGSAVDPLWAINGNNGDMYLFTADGLFVTQLFQDGRTGKQWNMPVSTRNMLLNDITLHEENFFPSLTQTEDGKVYIVDGARTSIVRVDGLSSLRKLVVPDLQIAATDLTKAQGFLKQREVSRQSISGTQTLTVAVRSGAPPSLAQVANAIKPSDWIIVDQRITQQGFSQKPDVVQATVTIAGGRLFAFYKTSDPNLVANAGNVANAPFKTGGALDLMIGANPNANPKREVPVQGDLRLLVYQVNGKTRATLYRAVVPGTTKPVPFSSPARTITLDQVEDVSSQVELSAANGIYSFSIPLSILDLNPSNGQRIQADIGILRGNGVQTMQRAYWGNKSTGTVSDVPSEAELTPDLWGSWTFQSAP